MIHPSFERTGRRERILRTTTATGASSTTGSVAGLLLGGASLVASAASTTVTEGCSTGGQLLRSSKAKGRERFWCVRGGLTTVVTGGTATAVATSARSTGRGLRLDVALGGARGHLVDGLDRDSGLLLTILIVT